MSVHTYFIGLGSNVPSATENLSRARALLSASWGCSVTFSTPVITLPVHFSNPALFTNQVAMLVADVSASALKASLKRMEYQLGRRPEHKAQGVVPIDLDLLCVDGRVLRESDWVRPDVRDGVAQLQASACCRD